MRHRAFGRTGWQVSALSIGTVELGMPYGLYDEDEPQAPPPLERGVELLHAAFEAGVNLVDTAPGYGAAEEVLGAALSRWEGRVYVATKVSTADEGGVLGSLERSLERLGLLRLDLVQIHNATAQGIEEGTLGAELAEARDEGLLSQIGASVYDRSAAIAALRHPEVSAIQVAFNLLDQRMAQQVLPEAEERGVAVLARSALLKGALTDRRKQLPKELAGLAAAAERAAAWAEGRGMSLPGAALRFGMSTLGLSSVLVGVRDREELDAALVAAEAAPFSGADLSSAQGLALQEERLIDPRSWGIP